MFSRLTLAPGAELNPVWSPDSRRLAYVGVSPRNTLFETAVGSGNYTEIPAGASSLLEDWTGDGKSLVTRAARKVRLSGAAPHPGESPERRRQAPTILEVAFGVDQIRVSPDRRWVAYPSFEYGQQPECYVAAFPSFTDRRQNFER